MWRWCWCIFQIGEPIKVWYQSALDKVHSTLEKSSNPFDFLCQALNLKAKDGDACDAVDKYVFVMFAVEYVFCIGKQDIF